MKFTQLYEMNIKDVMRDAEVELSYYIQDPNKKHASALPIGGKQLIFVKRDTAVKYLKKIQKEEPKAQLEIWPGLHNGGIDTPYGKLPKKYKIIEV